MTDSDAMLQKAMNTLEEISQDPEFRRLYEMRQKALHDEASLIEGALEEGKAKGIAEGRAEGKAESKAEIAKNMLTKNMDIKLVAELTGLPEDEVKKLR